jgi:nicotinate-nucleotide adenylyltransferase
MAETRLLVFGGSFDPPHRAHTVLPPLAAEALGCRGILYVPAALNPLKADEPPTAAHHRLAMLRLAIADVPAAEISMIELDRPGPSYAIDTLRALRDGHGPETELVLLIGSDQALQFRQWKDWSQILDLARPAVMVRPPLDEASYRRNLVASYTSEQAERWLTWTVDVPQMDICATEVRRRIAAGEETGEMLDPRVLEYIRIHGLYGSGNGPQV